MATDNYYFERNDHDTSIDSLPSILSERPSHNTLQDLINYNISPKLFNGSDLTYGLEKSVHESREFVRKSANRNFKPPQIDRNSMLSPGRKEYVVEINDQNAFLQPDSKKFMNKKIIKGIKSSKITGNLAPEVTTKKPKTPNKTAAQKSKTGFQPTNWTSPNMKKLPPNPSTYTIMESSQAMPEKLNRISIKSRNTPVPETIYEDNLYPSTSTLGEDKPEPEEVFETNASIVDDFAEGESQDHPIPENVKPPSPSESMIYKKPKRYGSGFDQAKLNLSINLEEEEEESGENIIPKTNNPPSKALGNKEKQVRPFLGLLQQKLITDDSLMDPPTTPNRTRMLRDYSSFMHGESSIDNLGGTNRESNFGGSNNKLDNTVYLSPRSDGGDMHGNFSLPQENRLPSSPQSSDTSFVSCLSYNPNFPTEDLPQNNSFKKIEVQVSKATTNDKDFIKNLLHNIEKENKNPPKNAKTEYRYAATTKAKDQPYLSQLNSQTFKKSLDINKNREAMLKNSYKILKDLDTVWFTSEAERDEIIYKAQQPQTTKQSKQIKPTKQTKIPPLRQKPEFDDNEQEFRHPCSPKISPKEKSKKFEPPAAAGVYTERSLTDIVLSNDFQPKIVKNVNLSISALKVNESSQDLSREYANKTDFSISQSMIPCENDEYSYESVDAKVKGLNAQPPHMGKKLHPQKVLDIIEKTENLAQKIPESADIFDEYESFQDSHENYIPNNDDEIVEPSPMRYRVTLMDQSQLPVIDEVSSTHMLTASYVENQPSLAQKNNLTNISIHSDYCLTEPDPNFSRILTELPQDLIYGGSLDNLDLLCYENVQNSSDSNRIISDSIREMNNYSADEKQKTIGNLLEGLKPELSSLNMNLIKTKSSGTTPQASSQRRKVKKSKYDENPKKRNASGHDFIPQIQKSLPKKMEKAEKGNKFYEMGYDNISREVLMQQTQENCLMSRLDKNTEFTANANGINTMKTSKQTQSISITSSKAPLKLPKSTNSLTAIPIAKKKPLVDKENQERRDAPRTFLRRPDLTKEPLQAKILNSYTKKSSDLGYKDENLLSSRNSSLSEIDPLVSNEVLKGQAMCYAGLLNNYNFLDNDKLDVSRKHHK